MSISSVTSKVIYVGDAATATLAYPFKILAEGDLTVSRYVTLTSVASALTLNTDYAVTGVGVDAGGNVLLTGSYAGGMPTGSNTIIRRVVDLTQTVDYVENDPFPAATHEKAIDKLCMSTQQLQEQIDRAVLADINQTSVSYVDFTTQAGIATSSATVSVAQASTSTVQATNAAASAALASTHAATASTGSLQTVFDTGQTITNTNTEGIFVSQNATLLTSNQALTIYSNVAQTSADAALVKITQDHASSTEPALEIANDGTGAALEIADSTTASQSAIKITHLGKLSSSVGVVDINSNIAQTVTNACALKAYLQHADSTQDTCRFFNAGIGTVVYAESYKPLATGEHVVHAYSDETNVSSNSALVKITQDNVGATEPSLEIDHDGFGGALEISSTLESSAHIRLTGDCANDDPVDGDFWFDGTSFKVRIGSTTATLATD